tara:strand:+ start:1367 stop:2257 length:891 start_codon:yes stop_codon:yes gene_type:complete
MNQTPNYSNAITTFRAAAENALGTIPGAIEADGRIHRFRTERDKPGQHSGWYVMYLDNLPAGAFGDWKTGINHTWCATGLESLPQADRLAIQRHVQVQKAKAAEAREKRQAEAANKARKLWDWAKAADPHHPYLQAKQVQPHGLRQHGSTLLVPLVVDGTLVNLQRIYPNGEKRFLGGGRVSGAYSPIGLSDGPLYICEGWATGATIHTVTGSPVACAMNCGNLMAVCRAMRQRYPGRQIIVAGDNDRHTDGNPGKTAAEQAAKAIRAEWVIPTFPKDLPGTDFNDLARMEMEGKL